MHIEGFSIGIVATLSLVAALFFLRFWRRTGDFLFMAFAIAFGAEAVTRTIMALRGIPDTGYSLGVCGAACDYLFILAAILVKNRKTSR